MRAIRLIVGGVFALFALGAAVRALALLTAKGQAAVGATNIASSKGALVLGAVICGAIAFYFLRGPRKVG